MIKRQAKSWCAGCACAAVLALALNAAGGNAQTGALSCEGSRRPTPDFINLDSALDRQDFRAWFTTIAELQALRPPQDLPPEIVDCAALLRYAYRGALHVHTADWLKENELEGFAFLAPVAKYYCPAMRALGAALFRVRPAAPEEDPRSSLAEFADAKTLWQLNTFFVSRDVRMAQPGDLLFYRQLGQRSPYHSMIFVGHSQFDRSSGIVVYHTGPNGKRPGEMRRTTVAELLEHPSPRWRPSPGNYNFLGVYRWNILREAE